MAVGCGDDGKKKPPPTTALICESDQDCDGGRCDPFVGCAECLFDAHCGDGSRCVERTCHEIVACSDDDACKGGSCDVEAGHCIECAVDRDCGDSERCSDGFCIVYAACEATSDCDAGRLCDTDQGACVGCLGDNNCGVGAACSDGTCVGRCRKNEDCPAVYHCSKNDLCAFDVCEADRASCFGAGNASLLCTPDGDAFDLLPCESNESCVVTGGEAECQARACTPGEWACDEAYLHAELCASDGRGVVQSVDCTKDGQVCDGGECVAQICEPESVRCDGAAIASCSFSGTTEQLRSCGENERCDTLTVTCVGRACEADSGGCLAETLATCNEEGSAFEATGRDCADSGLACWEGGCHEIVCDGGAQCVNGDSYSCSANRTQFELTQACDSASGQFCNAETGQCQPFVCEPGQPTCNGDLSTSCADDGSHALDVGVDCAATGKRCWAAECLLPICEDGTYQCSDSTVQRCVQKGTALETVQECAEGTVCDLEFGTCRVQKCIADGPACDGNVATTCDSLGLGYTGATEDCSADRKVCVAGACVPIVCDPKAQYCQDNQLRKCGPNGGSFKLIDDCLLSEHCLPELDQCAPDVCVAGAPVCKGQVLGTCAADGSGPVAGGTDCTDSNRVCDRGACRDLICTPSGRFCDSGDVALCNTAGTALAPYQSCAALEHCQAAEPAAALCSADICLQADNGCSEEHLAECNVDGSAFSSVGADCSASNQVCDLSGSCQAQALDSFGSAGAAIPFAGDAIHFGLVHVTTPRAAVKLDAGIQPTSGPITWLVYKSNTKFGSYSLIDQIPGSATATGGYITTGKIDQALVDEAYYLFGVVVTGAHSVTVLENGSPSPASFGVMLGGFTDVAGPPPTINSMLSVGPGTLGDDVALRIHSVLP